jgi:stage VI sporulation protein D
MNLIFYIHKQKDIPIYIIVNVYFERRIIMSKEQHSPIRFQLEESIWLDHHANAAEITSLELEPEVEVIEDSDLIMIRGSLVLTGKFEPAEEEDDQSLDLESSSLAEQLHFQPLRVEQKEVYQRKHRGKIEKRFPVDVTVPLNKIDQLEDVFVYVEQFDYTVSEGHRLNVQAEVAISGIRAEAKKDIIVERKDGEVRAETVENATPESAAPLLPLAFDVAAAKDELSSRGESSFEKDEVSVEEPRVENDSETEYELENEYEAAETREGNLSEETEASNEERFDEEVQEEKVVSLFSNEIRTHFNSLPPDDERDVLEDEEGEVSREEESKTTTFLTQLLSERDEANNDFTRLKMCIIQRNESLEEIAGRYELKAQDIMRLNRLETEQVSKGQIIYIPKS